MLEKIARKNILELEPYTSAREKNLSGILMDANENGFGSVAVVTESELNRYPDPNQLQMRKLLGEYLGVDKSKLFFGVGSDEIIDLLIRIFCIPGKDNIVIPEPTYGMYRVSAKINDNEIRTVALKDNFQLDIDAIIEAVDENTKIIFLCSPNNPTGNLLNKNDIAELCKKVNCLVLVDEAYIDFAYDGSVITEIDKYENLAISRTFSKAWGMAGVRLGYMIANEKLIGWLFKVKAPYNINSMTRAVFYQAIAKVEMKDFYVKRIIEERIKLEKFLKSIPQITNVYPTDANFILFRTPNAKKLLNYLYENGLIIRDRSSQLNLEDCLRVSIGRTSENIQLKQAIANYFNAEYTIEDDSLRTATVLRKTNETKIEIEVTLDGCGNSQINSGIGFFDHMLNQISRHGNIDLFLNATGDLFVDEHHTVEDIGIALGEALKKALGDKKGIKRYGYFIPMDDSVAKCSVDLGGRAYLNFNCNFKREKVGEFPTELVKEFFRGLSGGLSSNIYIEAEGENDHHVIEAIFKCFAKALNEACRIDERAGNNLPSTKGVL